MSGCAGRFQSAAAGGTSIPNSSFLIPNGTPISYLITPICFRAPPAGHPTMTEWPRSAPQGRQSAARGTRCGERGRMVCAPTGSCLPFRFVRLPPGREVRVFRGEGGVMSRQNSRIGFVARRRENKMLLKHWSSGVPSLAMHRSKMAWTLPSFRSMA